MAVEENTPVLVGCGQVTQKIDDPIQALSPIELMKESSLLAFEDSTVENLENKIDQNILGGIIIKIGSIMIDSSLRTKLEKCKFSMKGKG